MKQAGTHGNILRALMAVCVAAFASCAQAATDPYLRIAEGDSRAKVIRLLGNPAEPAKDLTASERKTIKSVLKDIDNKNAVEVTIWKKNDHLFYLIGFNKTGTVAAKHRLLALVGPK